MNERRRPHQHAIAYTVLFLCAMAVTAFHFWFMSANSTTIDELVQIESGYRYWQCGDYGVSPENPPLAKLVAAFPVRHWQLGGFAGPCGSHITPSRGPDYAVAATWLPSPSEPTLLWEARAAMLTFALALLVLTFFTARSLFGWQAATIAAILVSFEPTLIAHGSLATLDTAFAVATLALVWATYEFTTRPDWRFALLLGISMGLTLIAKFLALPFPFVVLAIILFPALKSRFTRRQWFVRLGGFLCACAVAWLVIWAAYAFRYNALPRGTKPNYDFHQIFASAGMPNSSWLAPCSLLANYHLLPEAYIAGVATLKSFDASPTYLFETMYPEGLWYYYPIALLIKLTIPVLVLAAFAIVSRQLWRRHTTAMFTLLLFTATVMAVAMSGKVNMGVRHVFPVYPLLVLLSAAGSVILFQWSRSAGAVAAALITLHVLSSLHSAPQQLSYANELFGGPTRLYKYLVDSNLDWGQSEDAINEYVRSHPGPCAIGWFGMNRTNPPCLRLPQMIPDAYASPELVPVLPEEYSGIIIIQPSSVIWTDAYLEFLRRKPDETLANGSALVYRGRFDLRTLAAVRRMYRGVWLLSHKHDAGKAAEEFAAAEGRVPPLDLPRYEDAYGRALLALHRSQEAKPHFQRVIELSNGHPGFRREREDAEMAMHSL